MKRREIKEKKKKKKRKKKKKGKEFFKDVQWYFTKFK